MTIDCVVDNQIGYLTLNRPEARNALSLSMWEELPAALSSLQAGGAKVVVLTGAGASFAAGADLSELAALTDYQSAKVHWGAIEDALTCLWNFPLPTIAMVNGPAIGGGCLIAIACDLRYAAHHAVFGVPVARLGIVIDEANVARLTALTSAAAAKEILFLGETLSASRALQIGLVNAVVDSGALTETVAEVASTIKANSGASVGAAKRAVNRSVESGITPVGEAEIVESYLSPDTRARIERQLKRP